MFSITNWQQGARWTNWAQQYVAYPSHFYAPTSIDEICSIVKAHAQAKRTLRVTGAAHSFSPIALPQHSALSLHHLRGLISVNHQAQTATFWAGTYLYEVGPLLAAHGLALSNMGDIQEQTLAGVVATGTHGTGVTLGSFSSMVTAWSYVNGRGEYVEHRRGHDDLSQALHVSVGTLGIFVQVTLQVIPLYSLHYTSDRASLQEELLDVEQTIRNNRHVEWYYFPGSETLQRKKMNVAPLTVQSDAARKKEWLKLQLLENNAFQAISSLCKIVPRLSLPCSQLSSRLIGTSDRTDISYALFPTPRHVKFVEAEYAIPLEAFSDCLHDIHALFTRRTHDVHFPIECRTTTAEQGFLSPTRQRESAFFAFHMYKGMDEEAYFDDIHALMQKYDGHAHWGKMNRYHVEDMHTLYPQFAQFQQIRREQDPDNVFLTPYLRKIFERA